MINYIIKKIISIDIKLENDIIIKLNKEELHEQHH